jgi:Fe-S cluster biogenesis protein NfuA
MTTQTEQLQPISMREHVEQILDMIRPAVQQDDGDVELVDVSADGVVQVRFRGACVGCPSVSVTLQQGIERTLKQHVPEVTAVHSVA